MTDLRQAEPVAWMSSDRAWMWSDYSKAIAAVANIPTLTLIPLYTAPPQQQAEPVAWVCMNGEKHDIDFDQPEIDAIPVGTFLYTTPPQRPWVGLTEQDMPSGEDPMFDHQYFIAGMVYTDKVLREKNR